MNTIKVVIASLICLAVTAPGAQELTLTPNSMRCVDIALVVRCDDDGRANFAACGEDGTILIEAVQELVDNETVENRLAVGSRRFDCGDAVDDALLCDIPESVRGTFRSFIEQTGFFFVSSDGGPDCQNGLTVTLQ